MLAHGTAAAVEVLVPKSTRSGSSSTPSTRPVGPVSWARSAVVQPDPQPTSSTFWPGWTSSSRSIAATVEGCELV